MKKINELNKIDLSETEFWCSQENRFMTEDDERRNVFLANLFVNRVIILFASAKENEQPVKKEPEKAVRLTEKQKAKITADTKKQVRALATLPPPPYEIITPAPGMSNLNAAQLCNLLAPLFVSISAITAFSTCSPTITFCESIYNALFPLSSIGRKISGADKSTRDTLTKQLRDNFGSTLKDCALLCNGDKSLYLLIGSPVKRKGVRSNTDLPACEFKLNLKKGRGKVGISCREIAHCKGYTVFYGKGDFDPITWKQQSGSATQVISANLVPGEYINFVMIAYKGDGSLGARANMQGCNVPFS